MEDIANTRRIAGVMVPGCYYSRAGLDLMLEEDAKDYKGDSSPHQAVTSEKVERSKEV